VLERQPVEGEGQAQQDVTDRAEGVAKGLEDVQQQDGTVGLQVRLSVHRLKEGTPNQS